MLKKVNSNHVNRSFLFASLLILVVAGGLSSWKFNHFQVGTYKDDAHYIVLAESIVEGDAYGLAYPPGEVLPTRYPMGWPLILAPVYKLFDGSFQALKALSFFFTLANTLILCTGWRYLGFAHRNIGLAVAALYAVSPSVVSQAGMVMSEPAYLFFVLLGILLAVHLTIVSRRDHLVTPILLGVTWIFAAYVRTIGIALILATLLHLIWKRRWPSIAVAALSFTLTLLMIVTFTAIDWFDLVNTAEYLHQIREPNAWEPGTAAIGVLPRISQGAADYLGHIIRDALVPFVGGHSVQNLFDRANLGFAPFLVSIGVLLLVTMGYIVGLRRDKSHPVPYYVLFYMAIVIVWPWRGERFLYGILPFLIAYLLDGGQMLLNQMKKNKLLKPVWITVVGGLFLFLLILAQAARSALIDDSLDHVLDLRAGTLWLTENSEPDAIIIGEQPEILHLYTKRPSLRLPPDPEAIPALPEQNKKYILIAPELRWRDDGRLVLSERANSFLAAMQSSANEYSLVVEDTEANVHIFRVEEN